MMACLATLNLIRAGRFTGDITELADELRRAALRRPPDDLFRGELLAMRAALIGADAEGGNDRPATGHASGPKRRTSSRTPPHTCHRGICSVLPCSTSWGGPSAAGPSRPPRPMMPLPRLNSS